MIPRAYAVTQRADKLAIIAPICVGVSAFNMVDIDKDAGSIGGPDGG